MLWHQQAQDWLKIIHVFSGVVKYILDCPMRSLEVDNEILLNLSIDILSFKKTLMSLALEWCYMSVRGLKSPETWQFVQQLV